MKKKILLITLIAIGSLCIYAYKMYNKEHTNVSETKALEIVDAESLFQAFMNDEEKANATYVDQVIEVSGEIYSIDLSNPEEAQVVLRTTNESGYVRCGFKPDEHPKVTAISDSETIKLKGECKGINNAEELDLLADIDIVLSNCIIIE